MAASFAVVYGAPTPPGRLARIAGVARARAEAIAGTENVSHIDLSTDALQTRPAALIDIVNRARSVVFISPVYRASIPGVLKCLLDELPVDALKFKPVGIVAMGGSLHHYLGVDSHLRDILAWFGALVAPVSVYATGKSFDERGEPGAELVHEIDQLVDGLAALAAAEVTGPQPLASKAW
jgi:FMN reductase